MAKTVAAFRAADTLTQGELATLVAGLTKQPAQRRCDPLRPGDAWRSSTHGSCARSSSPTPRRPLQTAPRRPASPSRARFGTESVARLLGLRTDHPAQARRPRAPPQRPGHARRDRLLGREDPPLPRLGAAIRPGCIRRPSRSRSSAPGRSACSTPRFGSSASRTSGAGRASCPRLRSASARRAASTAPGFVWRVYKLQAYPGGAALAPTIKGRTTYQMSGEVPKSKRIAFAKLAPGDVLFFGPNGPRSTVRLGRPHRHLPRRRLDDPLLRPGRRGEPAHRLVPAAVRLGPPASGRSRPDDLALGRSDQSVYELPLPGDVARLQGIRQSAGVCLNASWGG